MQNFKKRVVILHGRLPKENKATHLNFTYFKVYSHYEYWMSVNVIFRSAQCYANISSQNIFSIVTLTPFEFE
jgi:hypothetical protein